MPARRRKTAEDGPTLPAAGGQRLTKEMLNYCIHGLETVLQTPEAKEDAETYRRMKDALKRADFLYPRTVEVRREARLWELENRDTGVATFGDADERRLREVLERHRDDATAPGLSGESGAHREVEPEG